MKPFYPEVHKKLGVGCMRLPVDGDEVDIAEIKKLQTFFLHADLIILIIPTVM